MPACGHADVSWPCRGHRAPTASVDAPISFTYHLPLCRSTTDIPYVISSFDAIPRFSVADPGGGGTCQITVTVICRLAPPGGTRSALIWSKVTAPPSPATDAPRTRNLFSAALSPDA